MPIRRYLFLGLTLVLVVALANLIIRGCRLEKEKAQQLVETVEEAKPSSTRVLNPQDLKIVRAKMEPHRKTVGEKPLHAARHEVDVYNGGKVAYAAFTLRFAYLSRSGETLETKTHPIAKPIQPGATLTIGDITVDDIPPLAVNADTTIASADIAPSGSPEK